MALKWKNDLRKERPDIDRLVLEMEKRTSDLQEDKNFFQETTKLTNALEREFKRTPCAIGKFFRQFQFSSPKNAPKILKHLGHEPDQGVRTVLKQYIKYCLRFRVNVILCDRPPRFRVQILPPHMFKFHVRFVNGELLPAEQWGDEEEIAFPYESEEVEVPEEVARMIDTREAKFVRVDDKDGGSALRQLAAFSYHDQGVTFMLLGSYPPLLYCLFGESVSTKTLRHAHSVVTAFQKKYFRREKRGRPPDLKRQAELNQLLKKPGRQKERASTLPGNLWSNQVILSRAKSKAMKNS
jgi:hypothetical protein